MAKQHQTIKEGLTTEQYNQLTKVALDVFYFAQFIWLIHPTRGRVPFDLYPFQKKVLWYFLTKRFSIILKFRQAGVTELISLYCLWLAMYHSNKNIVIISLKERVAKKVLRKIKFMYRNLPEHLRVDVINGRSGEFGTSLEMEFANGSTISSIPTTEDAGRSEGLTLLVIDEAAIIRWANQIWASALPTLSTGGAAIVNSTPYGVGNWYHKLWVNACAGGNEFFPIRLRWEMHPERDMHWYIQMKNSLGPRKTAQEIDGDFLTSGTSVFDLAEIRAIEDEFEFWANRQMNPDFRVEMNGQLIVFKKPNKSNDRFWIGGDVASGRARDYSAFSIMDRHGEEYAVFKGKIHPKLFGNLLMEWGDKYNKAELAPEGNDIGLTTVSAIQDGGYPYLYHAKTIVREKGKKRAKENSVPGWYTTKQNRPVIISNLEEDIRQDTCIVKDPFFTAEAYTFIYDDNNKAIAMGKGGSSDSDDSEDDQIYTDDAILAKAITNHVRKGLTRGRIKVAPQAL